MQGDVTLPNRQLFRTKAGSKILRVGAGLREPLYPYRVYKIEMPLPSRTSWSAVGLTPVFLERACKALFRMVFSCQDEGTPALLPMQGVRFREAMRRTGPPATSAQVIPDFKVLKRQTTWWKGLA